MRPFRKARDNGATRRVKEGEPFDPEELSRRLSHHLAGQKSKADHRRDARAAKAAHVAAARQDTVYQHVPKVAAAAFTRTATPDVRRQTHKLSQPALKQRFDVLGSGCQVMNLQRAQATDQAMIEREMLRNRNQFQCNHDMEKAAEVDIERGVYKPPRRTFSEFAHLRGRHERDSQRPGLVNTGDVCRGGNGAPISGKAKLKPTPAYDGRNDWAQPDEIRGEGRRTVKELARPFLKRKDSIWILRGRKEKPEKQDKDEAVMETEDSTSPDGNKSGRTSFLARFKRHSS
jgi:hypothetical protein